MLKMIGRLDDNDLYPEGDGRGGSRDREGGKAQSSCHRSSGFLTTLMMRMILIMMMVAKTRRRRKLTYET